MGKTSKSTKKFQNKHLKHTIEHRKEVQKHNKLRGNRKKKSTTTNDGEEPKRERKAAKEVFEDMPVDEFFASGFEVPKEKKSKSKKESESEADSDEESSSDEEDEEQMKADLDNLKDKDPEFYKYLQENDKGLLDFEGVNPLEAMGELDEEVEEEEEEQGDGDDSDDDTVKNDKNEITIQLVQQWSKNLESPNRKIIRNVCVAFKAAVNINNSTEDYKYAVTDPKAFQKVMLLGLKKIPQAIQKLVKYKIANGSRTIPQNNPNVSQLSNILKSHAGSYLLLLGDSNNTDTAALVLSSLQELLPYYISHRKLVKQIINSVVNIWASSTNVEIQIAAFAFLNNAAREYPKSLLELILKSSYSTFLQNCRKTNVHTMPQLNFCKNSAAELYGINETTSYQVGFEFVRQLAIHLRNSINGTRSSNESYKAIYNWQYCHSLDFWSRVIAQSCNPERELQNHKSKESPMRQLIYPLVQVTLGAIRLIPTAQFFPLRFYLIRSLLRLSQQTGVYIPIYPLISEILTSTAITKAPKPSKLQAVDFENNIKVNQAYLGTKVYQEGLCEQFIELTSEFFIMYTKSIAFPELVTPVVLSLRRFMKKSRNTKFNKQLQQLVEKLNTNATFITQRRSNVEYGPTNKTEASLFLNDFEWSKTPLGQYVVVQRQIREERRRILQEALEAEEEARKKQQQQSEDEEDQSEEEDQEMED
ncbi:Nucleolar Complex 2 protein [Scheffersomyces spartinae]|uniref:Nucleolar Complex 2 protein n=1 Tax=Scheffersomyces spartinae TaxID=45513 RepID=A0A9P7VDQ8_9ASCO|nr:Nucleolar Complex 2 protein [Scheffersomyces spartinae]KAG7195431.1 Nucleolar Complex 2 protein [Scheffersomyces spartinae]